MNGRANLRIGEHGQLIVDIVHGGKTLTFRTSKVPYVATGFVPEMIPGAPRGLTPTVAATKLDAALKDLAEKGVGDTLRAAAQRARNRLKATPMVTHDDAIQLLSILGDRAIRSAVESVPEIKAAWGLGTGAKHWRDMVAADDPTHPHVFFGDHANLGREQALRSNNWVVAGTGGTAVSAAEIVLSENAKAHVTLVGPNEPAGLLDNDQFRELAARHADAAIAEKLHALPGDGRLHMVQDYAGAPQATDRRGWEASPSNQRWIDESNIPAAHRSKRVYDVNGRDTHVHGSAYVAAVGRADAYPPAVAALSTRPGGSAVTTR